MALLIYLFLSHKLTKIELGLPSLLVVEVIDRAGGHVGAWAAVGLDVGRVRDLVVDGRARAEAVVGRGEGRPGSLR